MGFPKSLQGFIRDLWRQLSSVLATGVGHSLALGVGPDDEAEPPLSALSSSLQHSLLSESSQSPCFLRTLHMQVLWLECAPQLCLALCIQSQSHRGSGLSFPHPQSEFNPLTSATSVLLESQDSCNKTGGEAYLYTLSHLKTTPKVSRRSLSKSQCYLPGLSLHATPAPGPHLQGPATTPTRPSRRKQNLSNQPSSAQLWTWGSESPQILHDSGFTAGLLHLSERL